MKIALIVQNADRRSGGAEQYTLDLARALATRGHPVTVVAEHAPGPGADGSAAMGYECVYLGAKGRTRWARLQDFLRRAQELYERGIYEVVHAMLPVWQCDVYQPHAGLAADMLATGHMKHPHAMVRRMSQMANHMNPKRVGLARIEEAMMRHDPYVLCFSSMMRNFARERFAMSDDHLVMLINGIDLGKFDPVVAARSRMAIREEWKVEKDQRMGLLVGHNWKLKGVHEAIDALRDAGDERLMLMVAGRDDAKEYQKHARKAGVGERVIFAGSVGDPRPLYGAADFLLLPTRRDTCSLVVLEALAMGLPVITTRQNGASEVIEHGRQGFITERGNGIALAKAMKMMLDSARREEMSREAIAMRERLSFDHHVTMVESVYQKICDARPAGV